MSKDAIGTEGRITRDIGPLRTWYADEIQQARANLALMVEPDEHEDMCQMLGLALAWPLEGQDMRHDINVMTRGEAATRRRKIRHEREKAAKAAAKEAAQ